MTEQMLDSDYASLRTGTRPALGRWNRPGTISEPLLAWFAMSKEARAKHPTSRASRHEVDSRVRLPPSANQSSTNNNHSKSAGAAPSRHPGLGHVVFQVGLGPRPGLRLPWLR